MIRKAVIANIEGGTFPVPDWPLPTTLLIGKAIMPSTSVSTTQADIKVIDKDDNNDKYYLDD